MTLRFLKNVTDVHTRKEGYNKMDIQKKIAASIRDINDFPVKGVIFKDITPIMKDISLFNEIIEFFYNRFKDMKIDKIAAIESRGFIFAMPLAVKMNIPFIPIRKKGKLPAKTIEANYDLEYGQATIEIHEDAIEKGENILVIDDLLATGGTVNASVELIEKLGAKAVAAAFVVELTFLNGRKNIKNREMEVVSILKY